MNFATWNVRGLNKKSHQKELKHFISNNNLSLMCCIETRVKVGNSAIISKRINSSWSWQFNYENHYNGRIWVGWDANIWHLTVHSKSAQTITCFITHIEKQVHFYITFVYALYTPQQRMLLWDDLVSLSKVITDPWCVLGDFNCITSLSEVNGGREQWTVDMQNFKDCIFNAKLGHTRTVGPKFTWANNRSEDFI